MGILTSLLLIPTRSDRPALEKLNSILRQRSESILLYMFYGNQFRSNKSNVGPISHRHCIRGLLAKKIVLLTTHNSRYFHEADEIIYLRGGKMEELKVDALQSEMLLLESARYDENMSEDSDDECYQDNEDNDKRTINEDDEERGIGRVAFKVYKDYFSYGARPVVSFIVALVFFSGQGRQ